MKISKLLIVLFIANIQILIAQIPHLTGEVKISILNGTIEGDLEYSNLPKLKNYSIWLNTGLNLRYFRDGEDKFNYGNIKYYDDGCNHIAKIATNADMLFVQLNLITNENK